MTPSSVSRHLYCARIYKNQLFTVWAKADFCALDLTRFFQLSRSGFSVWPDDKSVSAVVLRQPSTTLGCLLAPCYQALGHFVFELTPAAVPPLIRHPRPLVTACSEALGHFVCELTRIEAPLVSPAGPFCLRENLATTDSGRLFFVTRRRANRFRATDFDQGAWLFGP